MSCRDVVHYALLPFVDIVLHGVQTRLLKRLLKGGIDPATAWASVGHHIRLLAALWWKPFNAVHIAPVIAQDSQPKSSTVCTTAL